MQFIANTGQDRKELLSEIGISKFEDLIKNIPASALFSMEGKSVLKDGISEMEVQGRLSALADKNRPAGKSACFLGAGSYNHFIPAVIPALITRGEFLTAYTPYQPEASQGTLQATFEFQTLIAGLYGMDVANASLYDGASALAEAALLAARETGRRKILVSRAAHPEYRRVVKTYGKSFVVEEIALEDGRTSLKDLRSRLDGSVACVMIQTPNFLGILEDGPEISDLAHGAGALFVVSADPLSLGLLSPPGEYGADVAVGEGQPLGIPMNFGGPYLGLFTCSQKFVRKMPGRVAGMTKDLNGKRGFALTLQTREQHIRREKATSNICTNEALMALAATIYLSVLGPEGLKECATLNYQNARAALSAVLKGKGFSRAFDAPFFNEFTVRSKTPPKIVNEALLKEGITGGLPLGDFYPELKDAMLFCATEMNTPDEIERLGEAIKKIR
ncbi:MAG: glycine dehydrogenase (aminomethyl-transferring) [Elusimicrobia bacterium RIFCSPLOWO2_01_FULL_60_11]|nr:MAG: glycine dehydrogenase (aminomethyl-transferring) [Elusimicrobia bacterium RIFCSPLOWO2_01_FULL_60_11]